MSELEQLQGALDAYQGEVSSAMQTTKLTQEKLQDALSVIKVLTRERDEALEIAERTHTDMHAVRKELEQQRQRAEAAEAKLAAVPVDALINMLNPGGAVDEDADKIEMWIRQLKNSRA